MNTPTKEQRDKINEAIDKVTNLCASGNTTPSKAVAKVASAMRLTDDYLPIIVRAYNTGAATIHRENSHSLQEKVASYPIANLDEVRSILQKEFPLNKKAVPEAPRDTFWEYNANYHFPNAWAHLEAGLDPEFWDVKQASVKQCTVARDRVRSNVASTAERAATEATRIKYAAVEGLNQAVADLESILCKTAGITLDTARDYASAVYGDTGLSVINKLIKSNNLEKTARYRRETYIPTTHPFAKAFDKFVLKNEQVKKASKEEKEVVTQCLNTVNELVRPKDRYVEDSDFIDAMLKEGEMCRRKKDLRKHYEKKKEDFLKEAYRPLSESGVGGISGLEQLNHPGWVGLDRFERELMYGLADPAHEAKLRNIRVQTILTDLMSTDPYLKDKDPEEVIDAMNDIMEINPDLHKNKPMLRLALRQYMESGGMDIPTLGVLSEFGKEERERKSRERSQAESSAQQFASQQESARQADEKLRSEEMRVKEDRESKERTTQAEIAAKAEQNRLQRQHELDVERLRHPEAQNNAPKKRLPRRIADAMANAATAVDMIRHPRQAISHWWQQGLNGTNEHFESRQLRGEGADPTINVDGNNVPLSQAMNAEDARHRYEQIAIPAKAQAQRQQAAEQQRRDAESAQAMDEWDLNAQFDNEAIAANAQQANEPVYEQLRTDLSDKAKTTLDQELQNLPDTESWGESQPYDWMVNNNNLLNTPKNQSKPTPPKNNNTPKNTDTGKNPTSNNNVTQTNTSNQQPKPKAPTSSDRNWEPYSSTAFDRFIEEQNSLRTPQAEAILNHINWRIGQGASEEEAWDEVHNPKGIFTTQGMQHRIDHVKKHPDQAVWNWIDNNNE